MLTRAEFGFFLLPTGKILLNGFFFFLTGCKNQEGKKKGKGFEARTFGGF
jgi:hypothetical protein